MSYTTSSNFQAHPFHLVSPSPWPLLTSLSLLTLVFSGVLFMHGFLNVQMMLLSGMLLVMYSMSFWFSDMMSEGTYMGNHTSAVQKGLNMGVMLFMVSEALFFLAMFWSFFHNAVGPPVEMGAKWPPLGMESMNPFELPLLNTILLLASGFTVTYGHHTVMNGYSYGSLYGVFLTVVLAFTFTVFQGMEYNVSSFTFADSSYGSCFYFGTGFHGLHVMMGTAFMAVGLWRLVNYHFTTNHHLGLESSMLYWHFVDMVWLFLFMSVYYWGS